MSDKIRCILFAKEMLRQCFEYKGNPQMNKTFKLINLAQ